MSVLDSIDSLATDTLTVRRRATVAPVNGKRALGPATTFTCVAVVQPAFNMNRVIGGANLSAREDLQSATDVRQLHTRTELKTRSPGFDPDEIVGFEGANWTVRLVEKWVIDDEPHYHVAIAKQTGGAS